MKIERKTVSIILVATIGLSLFAGLTYGVGGKDPLTQILQLIQAINTNINAVDDKLDQSAVILGSYSDDFYSTPPSSGYNNGIIIRITTDKAAIYTVTYYLHRGDPGDFIGLSYKPIAGQWSAATDYFDHPAPDKFPDPSVLPINTDRTFTIVGYGILLNYDDFGSNAVRVMYTIVVQGEADTVVQVG